MLRRVAMCSVLLWSVMSAEYVGAQTLLDSTAVVVARELGTTQPPPVRAREERPPVLVPLYLSFIGLQVMDGITTVRAITDHGGRELNPVMRPFAGNQAAILAVKATSAAGTVYAVERLWKRNRVAAVLTMVGINAGYAAVVANNLRAFNAARR
jgi:hypothetical protein